MGEDGTHEDLQPLSDEGSHVPTFRGAGHTGVSRAWSR